MPWTESMTGPYPKASVTVLHKTPGPPPPPPPNPEPPPPGRPPGCLAALMFWRWPAWKGVPKGTGSPNPPPRNSATPPANSATGVPPQA